MDDSFHVSAKAILVKDDKILLIQYQEPEEVGFHYNLPGGRIRRNERAPDACKRKLLEEAGAEAEVHELLFVYEYIGANNNFVTGDKHSVALVFRCSLLPGSRPSMETCLTPDVIQTDVCWVGLDELEGVTLYPGCQRRIVEAVRAPSSAGNRYWGDIP